MPPPPASITAAGRPCAGAATTRSGSSTPRCSSGCRPGRGRASCSPSPAQHPLLNPKEVRQHEDLEAAPDGARAPCRAAGRCGPAAPRTDRHRHARPADRNSREGKPPEEPRPAVGSGGLGGGAAPRVIQMRLDHQHDRQTAQPVDRIDPGGRFGFAGRGRLRGGRGGPAVSPHSFALFAHCLSMAFARVINAGYRFINAALFSKEP